jgi:hypothetical protein
MNPGRTKFACSTQRCTHCVWMASQPLIEKKRSEESKTQQAGQLQLQRLKTKGLPKLALSQVLLLEAS